MKRIELVIEPPLLESLTATARRFKLVESVECDPESRSVMTENTPRHQISTAQTRGNIDSTLLKVELMVPDDAATRVTHLLLESVHPKSIAIVRPEYLGRVGSNLESRVLRFSTTASESARI